MTNRVLMFQPTRQPDRVAALSFAVKGGSAYIRPEMRSSLLRALSCVLALGLVLVHVSPAGAGLLVCTQEQEDARPGCCEGAPAGDAGPASVTRQLEESDCPCCIAVTLVVRTTETTPLKLAVDSALEAGGARAVSPPAASAAGTGRDVPGNSRLPSIRAVVLLI